jgi:hypothetical protein
VARCPPRLATEVAYHPYRDFDQEHCATGLASVFTEVARVIEPGGFGTIAFAIKDPELWDALLTACRGAGFALEAAVPMRRSAPGLTESTMRRAPKADLLLTFQLDPLRPPPSVRSEPYPLTQRTRTLWSKLRDAQPDADTHDLLDRVLIDWFSWLYDGHTPTSVTRPTLDTIEHCLRDDPS